MFTHQFIYTLKTLFKNKSLIFWTFAFPIILSLLFQMAFSNIEKGEMLEVFDIGIVNNEEFNNNEIFKNTFHELGSDSKEKLFNISYVTKEESEKLLEEDKIKGYLLIENNEPKIITKSNGVYETILKYVVDEINETSKIISIITEEEIKKGVIDYEKIKNRVEELLTQEENLLNDISKNNMSYMMVEFYTLIAMTALYGGVIVATSMNHTLPNMSSVGKRVSISPLKKGSLVLSSILASLVIELIGVFLLLTFCLLVLKIDFGNNLLLILLLSFMGTLAGLSLGLIVSVTVKTNENTLVGIIIAISMAFSILSGMTGVTLKYVIDKNFPIINLLNPANMITDGFYSLYYYDTLERFNGNILSLLIFSFIFITLSSIILRRQKYDSI